MLGDKLKKYRKQKGFTQVEMADILGVSRRTYTNWEKNKYCPRAHMYIHVQNLLKNIKDA